MLTQNKMRLLIIATAIGLMLTVNATQAQAAGTTGETQGSEQPVRDANGAAPSNLAITLPAITVSARAGGTGDYYNAVQATTATKSATPIMETPVSVQVVTQEVLQDRQPLRLKEALENVSGVIWSGDSAYEGFQIRGFSTGGRTALYRNGLRVRRWPVVMTNVQRVEVVKGPQSVLYGLAAPGGLINIVTKRPLPETHYSIEQQIGSFDLMRTAVSATGPVAGNDSLLYRVDLSRRTSETFRDFSFMDRFFAYAALSWHASEATEFFLNVEHLDTESRRARGIPVVDGEPASIPFSRYICWGAGDYQCTQRLDHELINFEWSHAFNDTWKFTQSFQYYKLDYAFNYGMALRGTEDGRIFKVAPGHRPIDDTDSYTTDLQLTGTFDALGLQHQLLLGVTYRYFDAVRGIHFANGTLPGFPETFNIYNPHYQSTPRTIDDFSHGFTHKERAGVYVQDQISLWNDSLHVLVGGRFDWAKLDDLFRGTRTKRDTTEFSPRLGLLYQVRPWMSLYGSYSQAFTGISYATTFSGEPFPPGTAEQYEVGFKATSLDGRISATVAAYQITKQNISSPDPKHPGFSIPTGEVQSEGVELDVSGQITPSFRLIGSYAYTHTVITEDNGPNEGNRFRNVPLHMASVFGEYTFHGEPLAGLRLGAGLRYVGDRPCTNANTCVIPSYVRADAMIAYQWDLDSASVTLQLNANNLFDEHYFESAGYGFGTLEPGAPRNFVGTIRVTF